jgi:hypothetical protein
MNKIGVMVEEDFVDRSYLVYEVVHFLITNDQN